MRMFSSIIAAGLLAVAVAGCASSGAAPGSKQDQASSSVDDAYITSLIKSHLFAISDVKAFDIHVTTVNGVVTLTGTAPSADLRDKAVSYARETKGVKGVVDHIEIKP